MRLIKIIKLIITVLIISVSVGMDGYINPNEIAITKENDIVENTSDNSFSQQVVDVPETILPDDEETGTDTPSSDESNNGSDGNTTPPSEPETKPPTGPEKPKEPEKPSVNISNVTNSVISQVSEFMIKANGSADGLGYLEIGISTKHDEARIISDLVGLFRQEANVFGNIYFDLVYLGEYNGDYNFRCYRA